MLAVGTTGHARVNIQKQLIFHVYRNFTSVPYKFFRQMRPKYLLTIADSAINMFTQITYNVLIRSPNGHEIKIVQVLLKL